jgi:heat shock protein HslJ
VNKPISNRAVRYLAILITPIMIVFALQASRVALAQQAPMSISGTSWNVQAYVDQQGNLTSVIQGTQPTLSFVTDRAFSGDTGCNSFSGSYTVSGASIAFGNMSTTLQACIDPIAEQEQAYLTALSNSTSYKFSDARLILSDANGNQQVILTRASTSLDGTAWRVLSINTGNQAVTSVVGGSLVTLYFGDNGVATGSTGCNNFRTLYVSDTPSLSFGPVVTTRLACSDTLATQEQAFLAALAASSIYSVSGNNLTVRDANGATQLTGVAIGDRP